MLRTTRAARDRGFTLIELLVVIIIIGILAGVAIPVFLNQRDKAKRAATMTNMRALTQEIMLARENQQKSLRDITGNSYSSVSCTTAGSATIPSVTDPGFLSTSCGNNWNNAATKIAAASGATPDSIKRLMTDGWGHPILVDENEGEFAAYPTTACTARDLLGSAGSAASMPNPPSTWPTVPNSLSVYVPLAGFC